MKNQRSGSIKLRNNTASEFFIGMIQIKMANIPQKSIFSSEKSALPFRPSEGEMKISQL